MRLPPTIAAIRLTALLMLCPFAAARAQYAYSKAYLSGVPHPGEPYTYTCAVGMQAPLIANIACSGVVSEGTGYAASSVDSPNRLLGNSAGFTATGSNMLADALAVSSIFSSVFISGHAPAGSNLAFRFEVPRGFNLYGGYNAQFQTLSSLDLSSSYGYAYAQETYLGNGFTLDLGNAVQTANGFDLSIGLGGFSGGTFGFTYSATTLFSIGNYPTDGAYGNSFFNPYLAGIDAVDVNGNVLGSAVFYSAGNSTLDIVNTVPEPATLALLGVGLCAMGVAARRKRFAVA